VKNVVSKGRDFTKFSKGHQLSIKIIGAKNPSYQEYSDESECPNTELYTLYENSFRVENTKFLYSNK